MSHKFIVAKEGWPFIAFFAILTVVMFLALPYQWSILPLVLTIFTTCFFRNPERTPEDGRGLIVAPADGKVMSITRVREDKYLKEEATQIRIFLSIFNVHVNRMPVDAQVEWVQKTGGRFLPAYKKEAADKNARNYLGLVTDWGRVLVVQITGLIARRIVCWVEPGNNLTTGERFGLIRFGSCTELYLPLEAEVMVQAGQKIKGGETVIGKFCD